MIVEKIVKLNKLEKIVMEKLLHGESSSLEKLRRQFENITSVRREYTGYGFFTDFKLNKKEQFRLGEINTHLGDVEAMLKGMTESVGFVLFIKDGWITTLEGYTYGEEWPEDSTLVQITYPHSKRNLVQVESRLSGQKIKNKLIGINIDWSKIERFDD